MWTLMQQGYGYGMHYGGHWLGMHWGWWLFWLLLIGLGIWFVTRSGGSERSVRGAGAEEALRERYARGEISEEEFRSRLRVLRES
jgi:putative membrane protein